MPQINNFPGGFAAGLTIRGMPVAVTHPGKVFWLSNASTLSDRQIGGSNSNKGTFDAPFSTLNGAVAACVASRGDIIMVKPGHTETVSSATTHVLDKAGVAVIGLGMGSLRPTFTFTTATTAAFTIQASNVTLSNLLFVANFADVVAAVNVANAQVARELTVDNCEFRDTSSILNFISAVKIGTTANIADGFTFTNNKVHGLGTTAATSAVIVGSDTKRMNLSFNYVDYPILNDTAGLATLGALNHTNLLIKGNIVLRPNTSSTGGTLASSSSTACTGMVADNYVYHLDNSAGLLMATGTKLGFQNNYCMITAVADKSGLINPAAV